MERGIEWCFPFHFLGFSRGGWRSPYGGGGDGVWVHMNPDGVFWGNDEHHNGVHQERDERVSDKERIFLGFLKMGKKGRGAAVRILLSAPKTGRFES